MSLPIGARVGPYEIVSLLGVGGMGEVYRARDTRLDRTVAIKVLPSALERNSALRERFEREARAISALSHPNICALYDIGHDDGTEYLVMEYLEGETLAERIARGPLPATQVLRYGAQIAEALQKAHRAGITHRDLKPGNIMLTSAGAKLLDFGLAKFVAPAPSFVPDQTAPTRVDPLTAEGTIVGTFQYMSPEQIEGKNVDSRTDLFALGVILYEMTTGQRPFRGDSTVSLIASVLSTDPPPVRSLQPSASPALERIILTALEKNPDERWQTAQDIGRQLKWISDASLTGEHAGPAPRRRFPMAAVLLLVAVAASLLTWGAARLLAPARAVTEVVRLQFAVPPELQLRVLPEMTHFAVSPDGRTVAFVASSGGAAPSVYLRRLDTLEVVKVAGTEDAFGPFWSSDSQWIGFNARGKLWKKKIAGDGPPFAICEIEAGGARASWHDRTILFDLTRGPRREIYRVADRGGEPTRVTTMKKGEWRHSWPQILPDGRHFLYLSSKAESMERTLMLASIDSPEQVPLLRNVSQGRVIGKDRIAYVRDSDLLCQTFDFSKGTPLGEETMIASNVDYFYPVARASFDSSPNGAVVYRTNTTTGRLVQLNRAGAETRIIDGNGLFYDLSLSGDGKKAAVTVETRSTGLMDIWIYDLTRGVRDRFTSEPAIEVSPVWAPDGRSIVYSQGEGGVFPHLVRRAMGGSTSEDLVPRGPFQFSASFSPDGETVFYESSSGGENDIFALSMATKKTEPFLSSAFSEGRPAVSPDGQWLAFVSNTTGSFETYVQSLARDSARIRVSANGGRSPRWRSDSRELFFVSDGATMNGATPDATGRWDGAALRELFRRPVPIQSYAVLPDGQSFLISDRTPGPSDSLLHVILGFH